MEGYDEGWVRDETRWRGCRTWDGGSVRYVVDDPRRGSGSPELTNDTVNSPRSLSGPIGCGRPPGIEALVTGGGLWTDGGWVMKRPDNK